MAEEIKKEELEALEQEIAEKCNSEEDLYQLVCGEMLPEGEELTEGDLELVMGGMSTGKAAKIMARAYWDLCIKKKKKTIYSTDEIFEACNKIGKINDKAAKVSKAVLKWGIKWLAEHGLYV